jgi:hypothetical protein
MHNAFPDTLAVDADDILPCVFQNKSVQHVGTICKEQEKEKILPLASN